MPELRWTLLILGVVFIAVLAWWELRRQRHAPRGNDAYRAPSAETAAPSPRVHREPSITLPEIRAREPAQELPVIRIDDDEVSGPRTQAPHIDEENIEEVSEVRIVEEPAQTPAPTPPAEAAKQETTASDSPPPPSGAPEVKVPEIKLPPEPIVEWPEESQRRIVALRLVAPPQERFSGRAVRQALAAEGFVLGKFSIFHKPGEDGRAILSAASLTKPGTFDLETMDTTRFGGLNLFAVLPGPLPPSAAFDELLSTARALNARLAGALQDDRGQPLTPTRSAAIRQGLMDSSTAEPAS
ncbi:MAG TPA: cell division protein ZipA C-terminal FtsZ-binding domain-containing protein [Steroidobacteraceae bacterium]